MSNRGYKPMFAWVRAIVVVVVAFAVIETLLVLGVVTPVAIHGSSMAPSMLGPHVQVTCPQCDWQFAVGVDQLPAGRPMVCSDCQQAFDNRGDLELHPGERVWVNRLAKPGRWGVVVFRCPGRASDLCVKRVIGLPGEHVDFDRGDLLIDGNVYRKSLEEQRRMRQLVHRERDAASQWSTAGAGWKRIDDRWQHTGDDAWPLRFVLEGRAKYDELGYNQNVTRATNAITDVTLSFDLELSRGATTRCSALFGDGVGTQTAELARSGHVEWSLFDRQVLLAVDGEVLGVSRWMQPWPNAPELEIAAAGDAKITNLSVYRDAYYHTRPMDHWPAAGVTLGSDELFVVGDNVAISNDSRTWPWRGLRRDLVLGVPIRRE